MFHPMTLKVARIVGYTVFFLACFFMFLFGTFPAERFIPGVEQRMQSMIGRKVHIGDLSVSVFGNLTLSMVRIEVPVDDHGLTEVPDDDTSAAKSGQSGRPLRNGDSGGKDTETGEKKTPTLEYTIDEINVSIGFIALLFDELDVEADMDFAGGRVTLSYQGPLSTDKNSAVASNSGAVLPGARPSPGALRNPAAPGADTTADEIAVDEDAIPMTFSLTVEDVSMGSVIDLRSLLPLPLYGQMNMVVDISSETGSLKDAEGSIEFNATECSLGKGKSKLALMDGMDPMTVDAVTLDEIVVPFEIRKGIGTFKTVTVKSKDLDLSIEGNIEFGDTFKASMFNLYFRFKMLEGYATKSTNARTLVSLMDTVPAVSRAKRTDGFFGFAYRGRPGSARFRASKVFSGGGGARAAREERPRRERRFPTGPSNTEAANEGAENAPPIPTPPPVLPTPQVNGGPPDETPTGPFSQMGRNGPGGVSGEMAPTMEEARPAPPVEEVPAEVPSEMPPEPQPSPDGAEIQPEPVEQ